MGRNPWSQGIDELHKTLERIREPEYFIYLENENHNHGFRQGLSKRAYRKRLLYEIKALNAWIKKDG
jgi:hypothetical protein